MGFSYDVVTNTNDTGPGSFRQFITNAQANKGSGVMTFVPVVPKNSDDPGSREKHWQVNLNSQLAELTRTGLVINGQAYHHQNPSSLRSDLPGVLQPATEVGTRNARVGPWMVPPLELRALYNTGNGLLTMTAPGQRLDSVALSVADTGNGTMGSGILVKGTCTDCEIHRAALGSTGRASEARFLRPVFAEEHSRLLVTNSYIGESRGAGIEMYGSGTIDNNWLTVLGSQNASENINAAVLELSRNGATSYPGRSVRIRQNHISGGRGDLVSAVGLVNVAGLTISDNTLANGGARREEGNGAYIQANGPAGAITVNGNSLMDNRGNGVMVTNVGMSNQPSLGVKISENHFARNAYMAINLIGYKEVDPTTGTYDDVWPNRGINAPMISSVSRNPEGQLQIEGFAMPGVTLEFYRDKENAYTYQFRYREGSARDSATDSGEYTDPVSGQKIRQNRFLFTLSASESAALSRAAVTAIALDDDGNTSEFGPSLATPEVFGQIHVSVWQDRNEDGLQDLPTETGFAHVAVTLLRVDPQTGVAVPVAELTTDAAGQLVFPQLHSGSYQVQLALNQSVLNGWQLPTGVVNPVALTIDDTQNLHQVKFGLIAAKSDFSMFPNHQQQAIPGQLLSFRHTVLSAMGGQLTITPAWLNSDGSKASIDWPVTLSEVSCTEPEAGGVVITGPVELTAGAPLCFEAALRIPAPEPGVGAATLSLTATLTPASARMGQQPVATVFDSFTISAPGTGQLVLTKQVQNLTQGDAPSTANKAEPGDRLRYTLFFSNIGASPISSLVLRDQTPPFTRLARSVVCPDTLPEGVVGCESTTVGGSGNQPGYQGEIIWSLGGVLRPGAHGQVSYEVMVE